MKQKIKTLLPEFIIVIGVICLLHLRILLLTRQLGFGDFSPFPESARAAFNDFFYAWKEISLGLYRHPGYLLSLVQGVLIEIFRNPLTAQKFFIILVPSLSYFSFRYVLKKFLGVGGFIGIVASFFYAFSPVVIDEFLGGTLYSSLLVFSFAPIIFLLSVEQLESPNIKRSVILGWFLGLAFSLFSEFILIYLLILLPMGIYTLYFQGKKIWRPVIFFLLSGIISILFNPVFFFSNYSLVSATNSEGKPSNFVNSIGIFESDVKYTYSWSTFTNILKLGNNKADIDYTKGNAWSNSFFVIVLATFAVIPFMFKSLEAEKRQRVLLTYFCYVFFFLIILFTANGWLISLYKRVPIFFMFRNPSKYTLILTFFFTLMMAQSLSFIASKIKPKWYTFAFSISVLLIFSIYLWPLLTLDRGLSLSRTGYTIPDEYYAIRQSVLKDNPSGLDRTLWIPSAYETTSIKLVWLDRAKLESQIGISNFSDDYYEPLVTGAINQAILTKDKPGIQQALNATGVKYIVILNTNSTFGQTSFYGAEFLNGSYSVFSDIFSGYEVLAKTDKYIIYKNDTAKPLVYAADKVTQFYGDISNFPSMLRYPTTGVSTLSDTKGATDGKIISVNSADGEGFLNNLRWSVGWSWPEPSVAVNSGLKYDLALAKERLLIDSQTDSRKKADLLLWLAAKKVAEGNSAAYQNGMDSLPIASDYLRSGVDILEFDNNHDAAFWALLGKYKLYTDRMLGLIKNVPGANAEGFRNVITEFNVWLSGIANIDCNGYCYSMNVPADGFYNIDANFISPESSGLSYQIAEKATGTVVADGAGSVTSGTFDIPHVNLLTDHTYLITLKENLPVNAVQSGWITDGALPIGDNSGNFFSQGVVNQLIDRKKTVNGGTIQLHSPLVLIKKITNWDPLGGYELNIDYSGSSAIMGVAFITKTVNDKGKLIYQASRNYQILTPELDPGNCGQALGNCLGNFRRLISATGGTEGYIMVYMIPSQDLFSTFQIRSLTLIKRNKPILYATLSTTAPVVVSPASNAKVAFEKLSPVKYKVTTAGNPKYLVFNSSFNAGWELQDEKGNPVSTVDHTIASGFANIWTMGTQSKSVYYLVFKPQQQLSYSLLLTGLINLIIVIYLMLPERK